VTADSQMRVNSPSQGLLMPILTQMLSVFAIEILPTREECNDGTEMWLPLLAP